MIIEIKKYVSILVLGIDSFVWIIVFCYCKLGKIIKTNFTFTILYFLYDLQQ